MSGKLMSGTIVFPRTIRDIVLGRSGTWSCILCICICTMLHNVKVWLRHIPHVLAAHSTWSSVSLSILSCSQSGDHPENNLAKFGYMLDMKVENKMNHFYVVLWLPTRSYHKILMIRIFNLLRNLVNSGHIFQWKFLCIGRNLAKTCQ